MKKSNYWEPLLKELYKLKQPKPGERPLLSNLVAQRAKLRRGVGKKWPTQVMAFVHHAMPYLRGRKSEETAYLVAGLFALHPSVDDGVSIATGLRIWRTKQKKADIESDAAERRLVNLLNSSREDLPTKLRQVISLLKSEDIAIDWKRLLEDLSKWDSQHRTVQRQWAKDFWGWSESDPDEESTDENVSELSTEPQAQES